MQAACTGRQFQRIQFDNSVWGMDTVIINSDKMYCPADSMSCSLFRRNILKRKKITICSILLVNVLLLAACAKESLQNVTVEKDGTLQGELTEGLSVDITEVPSYQQQVKKMRMEPGEMDPVLIKEKVFSEDTGSYAVDEVEKGVMRLTTDEGLIVVNTGGSTKNWDVYNDFIHLRTAEDISLSVPTDEELTFQSKKDTEEKMRELVKDLGISFEVGQIRIESYTGAYYAELVNAIGESQAYSDFVKPETLERDWTAADEMYYVEVSFLEDGIPVEEEDLSLQDETLAEGLKMQVYLTKDGIQSFTINPLAFADKSDEEQIDIIGIPEGIEAVRNKYQNIVSEDNVEIVDSQLKYMILPDGISGDKYLIPVVKFDTKSTVRMQIAGSDRTEDMVIEDVILVNGETGRIIE